jgi:23S rRNA (uracil1939-C5)-methyltransferase
MKRGDRITVQVDQLSSKGDGIARVDEREIVIPRTVPGDHVEVYLKRKRRGRFEGEADSLLQSRYKRQEPPCPHFGTCGGCRWQDLDYSDQLQIKEQAVLAALAARGIQANEVGPILASPAALFYRNKMEFSFGTDREGNLQLGLHVRGRFNRVFDVNSCHLQSELSNRIVRAVRQYADALGLAVYDLKTHEGLLRFLVIRHGENSDQTMVNLVVSEFPSEEVDELVRKVLEEIADIDTFIVTLHQGKAQVAVGQQEFILKGEGKIRARCTTLDFELSSQSFFQPNIAQAERLYGLVMERAGKLDDCAVLDLYCGSGTISLQLARLAKSVCGIELAREAVEDAWSNAQRNGIENVEFIAAPAEEALGQLQSVGRSFDLVVVDPPRAGLHKRVRIALAELHPPKIIYVSCNPYTLAEDLEYLVAGGYVVERMQPVDMFPQTPHCEVVSELTIA